MVYRTSNCRPSCSFLVRRYRTTRKAVGQAVVLWSRKVEQTKWRRSTVIGLVIVTQAAVLWSRQVEQIYRRRSAVVGLVIVTQAAVLWSRQVEQIYRRRSTVVGLVIVNQAADDLLVNFLNTGSICFEPPPPRPIPLSPSQPF